MTNTIDTTPVEQRTYSEQKAAQVLGCNRKTLKKWRDEGKLRTDAVISATDPRDLGIPGRFTILYNADVIDDVAAGRARLDRQ